MAKIKKLSYFVCGFCLASMLFMMFPAISGPGGYNPWADINNDGTVDIYDAILLAGSFNTNSPGQNLTKASVVFDSGWINITDRQGQTIVVNHNLNVSDWNDPNLLVDISGKMKPDGELLKKCSACFAMPMWNKTFGSSLFECGIDLVQTNDGGFVLATMNGTTRNSRDDDISLIKLDASGNQQWIKTYASTGEDEVRCLIQTSDGGYALGCTKDYWGPGDMWLIKTDALGNEQWNKTYGGPTTFEGTLEVIQTNDGGYALAGETGVFYSHYDAFLVKTDADGNMQWNQTYVGGTWNTLWGIVQRSDGGYTLAGVKDWLRVWLIKADSNGTLLWEKTYEGSGDEEPRDIVQTFDGCYAIAGYTTSYGAGGSDGWLIKTDPEGNVQWNMTFGGPNRDEFSGVVQTADGGFALTGLTGNTGPSDGDAMLVKTDSKGSLEWSKTYGGSNFDFMRHLVLTSDGGVAMVGETQSFGAGDADIWMIRTCLETGLEQVSASANAMTLYRGPTDPYWNYVRVQILKTR